MDDPVGGVGGARSVGFITIDDMEQIGIRVAPLGLMNLFLNSYPGFHPGLFSSSPSGRECMQAHSVF